MTGAVLTHPITAGIAVRGLGTDRLENLFHVRPRRRAAARHQRRPGQRAFLAAGDTGADVEQALALDMFRASDGVGEMRVAAVDDDVARFEHRDEFLDEIIDRLAGFHQQHHLAGSSEVAGEFLQALTADDLLVPCPASQESVDLRHRAVETSDGETLAFHVQDQVLAHDSEPDQADIGGCFHDRLRGPATAGAGPARETKRCPLPVLGTRNKSVNDKSSR